MQAAQSEAQGPPSSAEVELRSHRQSRQAYRQSVADYFQLVKSLPLTSLSSKQRQHSEPAAGGVPQNNSKVLERTLSEQHKVIAFLHQVNKSLEEENKHFCAKLELQERELKGQRERRHHASGQLTSPPTMLERDLLAKEGEIEELKEHIAQLEKGRGSLLSAESVSQEQLESEQLHFKEQLARMKHEVAAAHEKLLSERSRLVDSETRVNTLMQDLESLRQRCAEQNDTVVSLRSSLVERDAQLSEISKAWMEERRTSSALKETQNKLLDEIDSLRAQLDRSVLSQRTQQTLEGSLNKLQGLSVPSIMDRLSSVRVSLFDQVSQRHLQALVLVRKQGQELGFKYRIMETPVSLRSPSLIVSSVKEGSISHGVLQAGDEILEVNGHLCRGPLQNQALTCLKQGEGRLRLVVARDGVLEETDFTSASFVTAKSALDSENKGQAAHTILQLPSSPPPQQSENMNGRSTPEETQTVQLLPMNQSTPTKVLPLPIEIPPLHTETPPLPMEAPSLPIQNPPLPIESPPLPTKAPPLPNDTPFLDTDAPSQSIVAPPLPTEAPPRLSEDLQSTPIKDGTPATSPVPPHSPGASSLSSDILKEIQESGLENVAEEMEEPDFSVYHHPVYQMADSEEKGEGVLELLHLQAELQCQQDKVEELQLTVNMQLDTIKKLSDNSNETHAQLARAQAELREAQSKVAEAEQEASSLRAGSDASSKDLGNLKNRLLSLQEENLSLQAKVQELGALVREREADLMRAEDEVTMLFDEQEEFTQKQVHLETENRSLQRQVNSLMSQLQASRTKSESASSQAEESLVSVQKELNESKHLLELRNAELQAFRLEVVQHKQVLKEKVATATKEAEQLRSELVALQEVAVQSRGSTLQLQNEKEEVESVLKTTEAELASVKDREGKMHSEVDSLRNANVALQKIVDQMEGEVHGLKDKLAELEQSGGVMGTQVHELQIQLHSSQNSTVEANRKLDEAMSVNSVQEQEVDRLKREVIKHQTAAKQLSEDLASARQQASDVERQLREVMLASEEAQQAKEETDGEIELSKEKLTSLESTLIQLQGDLSGAMEREKRHEQQLRDARATYRELDATTKKAMEALQAENKGLQADLQRANAGIEELRSFSGGEAECAQSELTRLEQELGSQQEVLVQCERERAGLLRECDHLRDNVQKQKELVESTQTERDALQVTTDMLKESLAQLETASNEKDLSLASLKSDMEDQRALISQLKQDAEVLKKEAEYRISEVGSLRQTIAQHEEELLSAHLQLGQMSHQVSNLEQQLSEERKSSAAVMEERGILQLQVEQTKLVIERREAELSAATNTLARLEDTLKSNEFMMEQQGARAAQSERQLALKSEELVALQAMWESLQRETSARIKHLTADNVALCERSDMLIVQLEERGAASTKVQSALEKEANALQSKCHRLEQEAVAHKEQAAMDQVAMQNLHLDLTAVREKLKVAESEVVSSLDREKDLALHLNESKQKCRTLEEDLAVLSKEKSATVTELEGLKIAVAKERKRAEDMVSEMMALHTTCDMNRQLLEAVEKDNSQLRQALDTVSSDREATKSHLQQVESQLKSATSELSAHQDMVDMLQAHLEQAEVGLKEKDQAMQALQQKVYNSESEISQLLSQLKSVESARNEAQTTAEQLISAQAALKQALTAAGDEREREIVKLQDRIGYLEQELSGLREESAQQSGREASLAALLEQLEGERSGLVAELQQVKEDRLQLKTDLMRKVSTLQETLDGRDRALREANQRRKELEESLAQQSSELANMQGELAKLVSLKVIVAEKEALEDTLHKEVRSLKSQSEILDSERQRLVDILRRHEVDVTTGKLTPLATPTTVRSASKEQLTAMLKERDEEVVRLREYVSRLLEKVVEKAPFLLESLHS